MIFSEVYPPLNLPPNLTNRDITKTAASRQQLNSHQREVNVVFVQSNKSGIFNKSHQATVYFTLVLKSLSNTF